ncbi:MAG: hypothetical protein HYT80_10035 [Euryarchaeota archaeon]|nr:hypothetical protein [Euryarchaeota archaeon]
MYISYRDPQQALEDATRLVEQGLWRFHEDPLGRRHAYERQFIPGKDPNLRPEEIVAVFQAAAECRPEKGSDRFFRIEALLDAADWTGHARILFHVDSAPGANTPRRTVIITAFRVSGWRPK